MKKLLTIFFCLNQTQGERGEDREQQPQEEGDGGLRDGGRRGGQSGGGGRRWVSFFHYVFIKNTNKKYFSHIYAGSGTAEAIAHKRRRTEGVGKDLME